MGFPQDREYFVGGLSFAFAALRLSRSLVETDVSASTRLVAMAMQYHFHQSFLQIVRTLHTQAGRCCYEIKLLSEGCHMDINTVYTVCGVLFVSSSACSCDGTK